MFLLFINLYLVYYLLKEGVFRVEMCKSLSFFLHLNPTNLAMPSVSCPCRTGQTLTCVEICNILHPFLFLIIYLIFNRSLFCVILMELVLEVQCFDNLLIHRVQLGNMSSWFVIPLMYAMSLHLKTTQQPRPVVLNTCSALSKTILRARGTLQPFLNSHNPFTTT